MSGSSTFPIVAPPSPHESSKTHLAASIRSPWVIVLWVLFLLSLGLLSLGIASVAAIAYSAATVVLFALPGFFVVPIFFGNDPGVRPERAIVGAVFGTAISSYVAIVVGYLYGWNPKVIAIAIIGLSCLCALLGRIFRGRLRLPVRNWTAMDHAILAGMGILLVLFTARPALHVGQLTSHGYAYTWLYGFDFIYRADVIQAMTLKLPPDWFWMTGVPLRMYLVGYAMPAFAYAASGRAIALHSVLLLITLCSSFLMLACLYIFLRTLFSETKVLLSAIFLTLFAYSYYWFYNALNAFLIRLGHGFHFSGTVSSVSHHFQRALLVEPQAALATSLLLIVLSLLALVRYRLNNYVLAVFLGLCLAVSFGAEAMQGALAIAWFGLFYLGRLLLAKGSLRDEYGPFLAAVSSCGLVCASFFLLGMYQRSTSHLAPIAFMRYWSGLLKNPASQLHGFDTFDGLAQDWHPGGEKGAYSTGGRLPEIPDPRVQFFQGLFEDTLPTYVPPQAYEALVINIDCDLCSSALFVLRSLAPYVRPGTFLYFDEFAYDNKLRAFHEFQVATSKRFPLLRPPKPTLKSSVNAADRPLVTLNSSTFSGPAHSVSGACPDPVGVPSVLSLCSSFQL